MTGVVKPMLAKDGDLSKINYPVVVQPKLDGIRALVVDGVVRSRTFKPIPNAEIQAALGRPEFEGLDGEIIVGDPTAEGCMQRTTSFVMAPNKSGEQWTYFVFDAWNLHQGYTVRRGVLATSFPSLLKHERRLALIEEDEAEDYEALMHLEAGWLAGGHEGIIVRDPSAAYKHGRSGVKGPLLKVKRFIDFEAEVIGVYEEMHNANPATEDAFGRTERSTRKEGKVGKGRLGGLVLRALNGPCEGIEFRCGTGFNAEQRESMWYEAQGWKLSDALLASVGKREAVAKPIGLNGKVAKIKSFPVGVKDAPRFPVFLGFRNMEVDG